MVEFVVEMCRDNYSVKYRNVARIKCRKYPAATCVRYPVALRLLQANKRSYAEPHGCLVTWV